MPEENVVNRDLVAQVPKLTLGTFFTLLYQGIKRLQGRPNQGDFLLGLLRVFNEKHEHPGQNTLKTESSQYKNCTISNSTWIPLGNKDYMKQIDDAYMNDFSGSLKRMRAFINQWFNLDDDYKIKKTSRALLDVIENDQTISKTALFYVSEYNKPILKEKLLTQTSYKYEYLLLGVLHYVLTHDDIVNEDGFFTIQEWEVPNRITNETEYFYNLEADNPVNKIDFEFLSEEELNVEIVANKEESFAVSEKILQYIDFLTDKYQNVTPIFQFEPRPFYSQYVNSSIKIEANFFHGEIIVPNPTVSVFKDKVSNYTIIVGDGGLGKTMMIHHLTYDSALHFREYKLIPFVVNLKNYNDGKKDLEYFIYDEIAKSYPFTNEELKNIFQDGNAVLLFDGLDEVWKKYIALFQRNLESFIDKYKGNVFIMSSRGYGNFENYQKFTTIKLCPLNLDQAVELVNKIEPDEKLRANFIKRLKDELYEAHKQFASNPMMLTILLKTFRNYADVPLKLHSFFSKAFDTLAAKHDADKEQFKRHLETNLNPDDFRELLIRFCTKVYFGKIHTFTKEQYYSYFNQVKEIAKMPNVKADDFMEDLKVSFCLVQEDGDSYTFTNETFKEYFVACQLIKFSEEQLNGVVGFLNENREPQDGDKMLEMLYDMNRIGVEENIFLPYLDKIFKECDEDEDPYMTFLSLVYPEISYSMGDVLKEKEPISSEFVYNFLRKTIGFTRPPEIGDYLEQDLELEFSTGEYYQTLNEDMPLVGPCNISNKDEFEPNELPMPVGYDITLRVKDLITERSKYQPLIDEMSDDSEELHQEYEAVRAYYEKLKKEKESKLSGLDSLLY